MATKGKTKKPTARREAADETTSSERLTALVEESDALARIVAKNPSAPVRVRPETLCRITEFSEHESNGRELDEGERVAVEVLPVLGQSAAAVEPGDGAFDHPTPGLDDEALHPIGSLDDLGLEIGQDAGQGADETTSSERLTALVEESDALARIVAKNPSAPVRVRPETLCRNKFSEHESNGRELERERVAVEVLPVLGQSAAAVEPGDGAFDHPTPGLDEALHPIGSLDDLGLEIGQDAGHRGERPAPIGAVGEQFPEKGKRPNKVAGARPPARS